ALGARPRARARGEHDRVAPVEHRGELVGAARLQVEDDGPCAVLREVGDVRGVADDRDDLVAPGDEQAGEATGDLAVAPGDGGAHGDHARRGPDGPHLQPRTYSEEMPPAVPHLLRGLALVSVVVA